MRKKLLDFMQGRFGILWCMAVLLSGMFPAKAILAGQEGVDNVRLDEAHLAEICKLLTNKTASEKAQIKSREIAKRDFKGEYTNTQYGVRVEIIGEVRETSINGQSGVELFAKAWRGDKQLGFGKDGSVEIERFRIFNPPILVDDPNGDVVREWTDKETGLLKQRKLREDPLQAIKEVIAHNVTLVGKDNGKIVIGKVGNTTSTFYPDSNPESTSVDGDVQDTGLTSWADKVAGTGEGFYDSTATMFLMHLDSSFSSNQWNSLRRGIALFDTSAIGDTDTIDSANLSFYGSSKSDQSTYAPDVNIYSSNPTSNTSIVAGDFATLGSTAFSTAITYANFSTTGFNDFALNASGIANISKTGVSKFGTRNVSYDVANTSPTWVVDAGAGLLAYSADQAGTTSDPKLVIVHSAPTSSGTITRVVNGGGSILGASSLTMNFNITGSNLILFVSTFKQNSEIITGVTWNGVPLTQVESVISYTTNNVQLWYLLAPAVGTHDLVTTASGSSGYIITDYALYSGVKQTGQLDGSTRVTGNTPITATITTGTDNTWAFLTAVQGGSAGTNATLIAAGDKPTYDNQGYGTIAPGTAFSMTVNLQPGNTGGVIMATFKDATPSDTTAPSGSISINSGASYTNSTTVTLSLSATDSTGVTGYYLSDSSTTPTASVSGWTSVTSTTSYSATVSYSLSSGEGSKTIYAWYKDAAGNVSSTANATITMDTTVPTVTISSPTSSSTYTSTSSTISLGGSASDSSSGISSVAWSNNRGGNGTATGTASWTVSSISLSTGDNVITVTAKDGANNSGADTLQVTYGTGTTVTAPTVSTGSASNVTTSSATLNGIINANGGTTTAWFQYGSTSGSYGNTSSTQTVTGSSNTTVSIAISGLSSGTKYYYRIAASNSADTSYGGESSFTTTTAIATPTPTPSTGGDTTAPTVTITSPTSSATYTTTSSTITLSGTASDNSGSVSSVTWSNSKGGSGTASGTTNWTISGISLSSGDNVITVTATDGSGNFGTDTITVTYHVTTTPTPTAVPTATTTPKPSPTAQPTPTRPPTLPPLPTPQVSPSPLQEGIFFGFVNDQDELPLKGVTITITGKDSSDSTETDENGYYEFSGLDAGEYAITYEKEGYQIQTQDISLNEGEVEDLGVVILEQIERGKIYGYVVNIKGNPLEFVRLRLKGIKTKVIKTASSDADGFFEFTDLEADTYVIIAKKKKYRNTQQKVKLEEGASEEIEIVMKKTSKRIKGLLLEEDVQ